MSAPEMPEVGSLVGTEDTSLPEGAMTMHGSEEIHVPTAEQPASQAENHMSQAVQPETLPTIQSEVSPTVPPEASPAAPPVPETSQAAPTSQVASKMSLLEAQLSKTEVHISPTDLQVSPIQYASPTEAAQSPTEGHNSSAEMYLSPTEKTIKVNAQPSEGKKTKRRGSAWTDDQTDFLMEVWARHTDSTGNEEYTITNAPIYRIISKSMGELGYLDKTSDQCKCRIHTLKRAYKLTKAEIDAGAQNITFCRHYEKLKIIMGDDPSTTPKQLAEILAERRRTKQLTGGDIEQKPKKLKPATEHKAKRSLLLDAVSPDTTTQGSLPKQPYKEVDAVPQVPQIPPLPAVSSLWNHQSYSFPFAVAPPIQNVAYQDPHYNTPINNQSGSYHETVATPEPSTSPSSSYDINHNTNVIVKQEKESDGYPVYQPYISKATEAVSQTKEEIERMRLDLEMKKIEMERNRLEMEERQRREDRDHQYRMMQLLLMGLGHNPGSGSSGQGSENDEAHQPELSRALEGGLVPGGAQSANEKGLSFSEI